MSNKFDQLVNEDKLILIKKNLYAANSDVYNQILHIKQNRLPAGYAWIERGESYTTLDQKEGQARTGEIEKRVRSFATRGSQIITHVIQDNFFLTPGNDQILNNFREDPDNESGVTVVREKNKRTKEDMRYSSLEYFQNAESSRLEALQKITNNRQAGRINLKMRASSALILTESLKCNSNNRSEELCPRFGKTIHGLSYFAIQNKDLLIYTAYVQGVFTSVKKDINKYHQFANIALVDGRDNNAEKLTKSAIDNGMKVVLLVGIHNCKDWENRYNWINQYTGNKSTIVDEVDFAVHTAITGTKVETIIGNDPATFMSGTGIDKIITKFKKIDKTIYFPYEEMLELKDYLDTNPTYATNVFKEFKDVIMTLDMYPTMFMSNLSIDYKLDIPAIGIWSRDFTGINHNMSFQKLAKDPDKHGAIIKKDTEILLGADDEFSHLSLSNAINEQNKWFKRSKKSERINDCTTNFAMIEFVPYNMLINETNNLEKYANYRQQGINNSGKKIKVIPLSGQSKHIRTKFGSYNKTDLVSNELAEDYARDCLNQSKIDGYDGIWLIASQYAQRSFTLGEIFTILLSFDAGADGRVSQCILRGASPLEGKTACLIISNSFNSTRDEKIDLTLLNMSKARQKRTGEDAKTAILDVKRGMSIFRLDNNGSGIQLNYDQYLYRLALQKTGFQSSIVRNIVKHIVNNDDASLFKSGTTAVGKPNTKLDDTFVNDDDGETKTKAQKAQQQAESKILKVIEHIVTHIHHIYALGFKKKSDTIKDTLRNIIKYQNLTDEFKVLFNIEPSDVYSHIMDNQNIERELEMVIIVNTQSQKIAKKAFFATI